MLIEHRVHDMNEAFVAGEKTVTSGEQISLQPALAQMFAQDLHHPAVPGKVNVIGFDRFHPDPFGRLEHGIEPV